MNSISNYDNYRVVNANHEIAKARRAKDRARPPSPR